MSLHRYRKASFPAGTRPNGSKLTPRRPNWLVALGGERVRLVMDSTVTLDDV